MKKQYFIIFTAMLILVSGILLAFSNKSSDNECKPSSEKCCEKKETSPGSLFWEPISRQFFTSTGF